MTGVMTGLAVAAALGGCATYGGTRLAGSPELSRADGSVRFRKTVDRGTRIDVRVKNMPEPDGLTPPGYAYIAWVQRDPESDAENVGAIPVDKHREGLLRTMTPLREFDFFVTAEPTSDAGRPSGPPLLWTRRADWTLALEQE
jgi:hypothetical protein